MINVAKFQSLLKGKDIKDVVAAFLIPDAERIVPDSFSKITIEDDTLYCYKIDRFGKEVLVAIYDFTQLCGILFKVHTGRSKSDDELKQTYFAGIYS